ncbi:MAG: cytochrome c [Caldilineaceae bacterium]
MRALVLCDDSAHPASLTQDGLTGLGECGYEFDWQTNPDEWSAVVMNSYPLVGTAGFAAYDPTQVTLPEQMPSAALGRALFTENCAPCHGADGNSDGPVTPNLPALPRLS